MRPTQLLVRCFAERRDGLWVAYCLDFALAAQAESFEAVRDKLDKQIREYVHDALVGEDRSHASALLTRRAPISYWLKFWAYTWIARLVHNARHVRAFEEPMPLAPATC